MVIFYQKINFLFLLNVPHTVPDWFSKYQGAWIFFANLSISPSLNITPRSDQHNCPDKKLGHDIDLFY